jgi:hypothetical protein
MPPAGSARPPPPHHCGPVRGCYETRCSDEGHRRSYAEKAGAMLATICEYLPYAERIKVSQTGLVFRRAVSGEFLAGERRLICCRGMPSAPAR